MGFWQSFQTALHNLVVNKIRSLQATLGFIIAITAVFTILCIGAGLLNQVNGICEQYSQNLVYVSVFMRAEADRTFTEKDLENILAADADLYDAFSPFVPLEKDNLRYDNITYEETGIIGVGEEYLATMPVLQLSEGRFLQHMDIEREQKVCVVGNYVAEEVLGGKALGNTVKIRGENYIVIGVLQEVSVVGEDWNKAAYIPFTNARKLAGSGFVSYNSGDFYRTDYYVKASRSDCVNTLRQTIWANLDKAYGNEQVTYANTVNQEIENWRISIYLTLGQPLFFAFIVLLVGCVGIMNMMTAIVGERTQEIGVRKAFGARQRDIKRQFLLESVCISSLGGLLGIVLGIPATFLVCDFIHLPVSMIGLPLAPCLIALLVAVCMGIVSGTYPAMQAAKLEPVAAINGR